MGASKSVRGEPFGSAQDRLCRTIFSSKDPSSSSGRADDSDRFAETRYKIKKAGLMTAAKGKVYFVGGGPGDPELLTIKAMRVIRLRTS